MENLITCKICGKQSTRIYGRHLKFHGLTSGEYLKLYPGSLLYTDEDNKKTTTNSGKHMKQDKYKKMFSEKIKGDNNPNSKSKTTEEQRKQRSPFSKNFSKYDNDKEAENFQQKVSESIGSEKRPTKIEYWMLRGYSEEESKKIISKNQCTFSLKICIEKYGEIEGNKIFTERQNKWQDSLNKNGNLKHGFSKASQKLFYSILKNYDFKEYKNIFFATKNKELSFVKNTGKGIWIYDYADMRRKKIIEYNGDEYHANPKYFKKDEISHPFRKQYTSEQIWAKDKLKLDTAKENGFEVLVIWDSEYKKDPDKVLSDCLEFLK